MQVAKGEAVKALPPLPRVNERVDGEANEAASPWLTGVVGLFRGLYGAGCGGVRRVPGVMMTSPVDLRQTSYTRLGSRRM